MNFLLLATEATEAAEGGGVSSSLVIGLLVGALVLFGIAYMVVGPGKADKPRTKGDIPLAMRPYHSDEELETTGLERAMSWGVALSLFIAVFIPLYWVVEPDRIDNKQDEFYEEDIALGRSLYAANCTTCHGTNAEGGVASHPDPDVTAPWPAPRLSNIAARYEDSNVVSDIEDFIQQTLFQGRPGTPMPAWGSAYAGPMNDQEIEAITTYLLSIQTGELPEVDAQAFVGQSGEEIYTNNCARCHGYDMAEGRVGPNLRIMFDEFGWSGEDDETLDQARASIEYILESGLYVPTGAIMPSFADTLTEDATQELLDYLESIQIPAEEAGRVAGVGQQGTLPQPDDADAGDESDTEDES